MFRIMAILAVGLFAGTLAAQSAQFTCSNAALVNTATITAAGNTQVLAPPALGRSARIYLCGVSVQVSQSTTPTAYSLVSGAGVNCATNQQTIIARPFTVASTVSSLDLNLTSDSAIPVTINQGVCLNLASAPTGAYVHLRFVTQ